MGKAIFWLVVVFGALFALRLYNTAKARARANEARQRAAREAQKPAAMVRCVECGVYLPQSEALPVPTGFRCGDAGCAHRR
jgi:hypothetical protein